MEDGWFLPRSAINEFQAKSLEEIIRKCRSAHHTDVVIRLGGQDVRMQADWIKKMLPVRHGHVLNEARPPMDGTSTGIGSLGESGLGALPYTGKP